MFAARARSLAMWAAALAVTCALWSGVTSAQQQTGAAKSEAERLLSQKALMLEAYLGSQRVAEASRVMWKP